jgi:hypothetical protein
MEHFLFIQWPVEREAVTALSRPFRQAGFHVPAIQRIAPLRIVNLMVGAMKIPCELIVWYVLPSIRRELAGS